LDPLEMVDIEHQQRVACAIALGAFLLAAHLGHEMATVERAGQGIGGRQPEQLMLVADDLPEQEAEGAEHDARHGAVGERAEPALALLLDQLAEDDESDPEHRDPQDRPAALDRIDDDQGERVEERLGEVRRCPDVEIKNAEAIDDCAAEQGDLGLFQGGQGEHAPYLEEFIRGGNRLA
jgi:hypothetical protein